MFLELLRRRLSDTTAQDETNEALSGPPDIVVQANDGEAVVVPGGESLLRGEFLRDGEDLLIACSDGTLVQVEGYFAHATPADIVVGGAVIPGRMAARLAQDLEGLRASAGDDVLLGGNEEDLLGSADPQAETQEAALANQAAGGAPVAEITELEGQVVVIRADGSRIVAETGTALYEDDVVTTDEGGSVGIAFVDGMSFSLGEQARLLLEEFQYDPESHDGGGLLSVLQGQFSFVSGAAAHTAEDALMIETPTMTIGVRGTKVVAHAAAEGEVSRIALLAEEDGTVGKIMVTTDQGSQLISEANMMVEVVSRFEAPSAQVRLSSDQVFDFFNSALNVLPAPAEFFTPDRPEAADSGQDSVAAVRASQSGEAASDGPRQAQAAAAGEGLGATPGEAAAPVATPVAQPQADSGGGETVISFAPAALEGLAASSASAVEATSGGGEAAAPAQGNDAPPASDTSASVDEGGNQPPAGDGGGVGGGGGLGGGGGGPDPAPSVATPIADQNTAENGAFLLDVSAAFSDPGDTLSFSAKLAGGGALPGWLSFDGATGVFSGTPGNGDVASLNIEVTATDVGGQAVSTGFQLDVTNVNDAPVLNTGGSPALAALAEDTAAPAGETVASIVVDGSITDPDGAAVEAVAVTAVDDTNGTWQYSTDGGTSFNAIGAVSDNSALLLDSAAVIRFVPNADYNGSATFGYKAWDKSSGASGDSGVDTTVGTAFSAASETASIVVNPINDAPVLNTSGSPALTAIAEDTAAPAGDTVASIVVDGSITDPDGAAVEAIAVTAVDDTNGTWQYSTDGGTSFTAIGAVSDNSALLLDSAAVIRFVPNADYNGSATFGYKAWDKSSGASGDSGVDTTVGTAFSAASETASIVVNPINDAPVLNTAGSPALTAIAEDTAAPAGDTVASIVIDGSITDPDGAAVEAVAVTAVDDANGTWEYSTDGGASFAAIGPVSASSALLLDATAKVRFVPDANFNGTATFTYKAWDQSSGASGDSGVDTTVGTAFSAASETAGITVTAFYDAPVLDTAGSPTLTAIAEDAAAPAGDTVADIILDGSISDPDGAAVEAMAVTGADNTNGTWEYSTDGGTSFAAIGAVSDSAALLLDASAKIRFVPNADYNGSASITYRAWDQRIGSSGESGVDVSTNGGTTPYSAASETATITVTAVNDAPVLNTAGSPSLTAIAEDTAAPAGDTVASIVVDGSITDPDGAAVEAIAVTAVDDTNGTWQYSTDGGTSFTAIGAVSDNSALLLDSAAVIRFVPNADYNGSATFGYKAWDQSSGASGDSGVDTAAGTAFSAASETAAITVTAVADAPLLDTAADPELTAIAEDTAAPAGDTVASIVVDGSITDPDGGAVEAIAVTGVDDSYGTWQYSTDGGTSFSAIGAVSDGAALLLDATAIVRFVPNGDFHGEATFSFKAWDRTGGVNGQSGVDTTGGTAFSSASDTASISVTSVADAPVLDTSGSPALTSIPMNAAAPSGNSVAEIVIDGSITDVDGPVAEAIAVTGVSSLNGAWQYSTDGGASFTTIAAVSNNSALLLDSSALIRFVPNSGYTGDATLTFKAWDQSVGSNGQSGVDTTLGTAFSTATELARISVTATNSAPVLNTSGSPALSAIAEDSSDPTGDSVASIVVDGSITDTDGARESIAVTSVDDSNGTWQYSTDGGATFSDIGVVSDSSALLLDSTALVRFVPDASFTGTATFGYKAWDESSGSNGQSGVDTTSGTAFSTASETGSITVVAEANTPDFSTGSEFQVNTTTADKQGDSSIAALDDGGFVIVWESNLQDGSNHGVYAQRYDAMGDAVGTEFRVNTTTSNEQEGPAAVGLDGGGFVVVWQSKNQDGHNTGVFGQRYDGNGDPLGGEFQVNTETNNKQEVPNVAALSSGGFVVTWESHNQDGHNTGIYGQRYDAAGVKAGTEFRVNTTTSNVQDDSQVVGLDGGGFVVVWQSSGQDANGTGIFAQRYDAAGLAVGSETQVNSYETGDQGKPAVEALDGGGFVIAWESGGQDGSGKGIFAQRFDAVGNAQEFEFQVNSETADDQKNPSITALEDGGFLIAWTSMNQDGSASGVYAQRFSADGDAIGAEFRVNTTVWNGQKDVAVETLESGAVVAAWEATNGQDGDRGGVFAHQFDSETASVTINAPVAAGTDALDLNGSDSFVDLGNNFDPGTGDMTLEAWFYYDGQTGNDTIISKGSGAEDGVHIFLDDGELVIFANPGGALPSDVAAMKTTLPAEPGWHHVAMVIDQEQGSDASTITGYLDGSSAGWTAGYLGVGEGTFTTGSEGLTSGDNFMIGAANSGINNTNFFEGQIADVRVWNTARSQSEIQADMSRTLNGDEDHLVGNWRLDEGLGTSISNAVAGGVDGSLTGSAGWESTTSLTVAKNGELDGRITATDAEGDSLSFSVSGNASNGTATIDATTGAWEYTPNSEYTGADSFSYQISDGHGGTDTVNVSVVVV